MLRFLVILLVVLNVLYFIYGALVSNQTIQPITFLTAQDHKQSPYPVVIQLVEMPIESSKQ